MASAELLETRVVSGKGLFKLDVLTDKKYRQYFMYVDVIRKPRNEYLNLKYNPPQSFYANVLFRRAGYVLQTRQIQYPAEQWTFIPDFPAQTLYAVKCAYEGILQSFVNQNIALGLTVTSVINTIKDYTTLPLDFDEFSVVCYSSAVIRFRLYGIEYDICDPLQDQQQPPGEPPLPEPGSIPPDSPAVVSPPYTGADDDGDSVPYDGDTNDSTPVPPTEECSVYAVTCNYFDTLLNEQQAIGIEVYGVIEDWRVTKETGDFLPPGNPFSDGVQFQLYCRGTTAAGACGDPGWLRVSGQIGVDTQFNDAYIEVT